MQYTQHATHRGHQRGEGAHNTHLLPIRRAGNGAPQSEHSAGMLLGARRGNHPRAARVALGTRARVARGRAGTRAAAMGFSPEVAESMRALLAYAAVGGGHIAIVGGR